MMLSKKIVKEMGFFLVPYHATFNSPSVALGLETNKNVIDNGPGKAQKALVKYIAMYDAYIVL